MRLSKQDLALVEQRMAEAGTPLPPAPKPRKYRNEPVVVDGVRFDSRKEAREWQGLVIKERCGIISGLERQVPFDLSANGIHVCRYVADFVFIEDGARVVLDCKGVRTREYKLKKKLMLACHGIAIREA